MAIAAVDFYVFSGTGNTLLVAQAMADVFRQRHVDVRLMRLEASDPAQADPSRCLGLAFPVACFSTYPFIWRFIERLPPGQATPAFMVDTLAGFSSGIVGPLKKLIRSKGYAPIAARQITMPSNYFPRRIDEAGNQAKRDRGCAKARDYAAAILDGRAKWRRLPLVSDLLCRLSRSKALVGWLHAHGAALSADPAKCVRCGLCAKLCPVRNITLDPAPVFGMACELCMRCLAFCPKNAITFAGKTGPVYRAVKASDLLSP
ncbi:MAG TPA: EFR1 family ferrodoxin [Candidatus Brocadiia bacterium]|nr:EFR1 family ferrodoxin [Candidatus Brocadiia bacterium]